MDADSAGDGDAGREPIRFDTKIAVLLRDDLEVWQRLNVASFLVSGIGAASPEVIGEPYADADGTEYLPMFRQPVLVYAADAAALSRVRGLAVGRSLAVAVYIDEMFKTAHDEANRAAVSAVDADDLPLVGLAVYGPRNAVDKVMKGLRLHP
jgi:hypothetical protein